MFILDVFLLSLVQGITEFLPISSSAHLVLFGNLLNNDFGMLFDIGLHFGSIMAVLLFYRKDVILLLKSILKPGDKKLAPERHLILKLIIGSIPLVIAGMFLYNLIEEDARNIQVLAINSIIFGILLFIADKFFPATKSTNEISYKSAFIIGLFQTLSLMPGVSRSGITITAARFLKVKRVEAIKFSVFLSIPAIIGASALAFYKNFSSLSFDMNLIMGIVFSFMVAYIALYLFVKLARNFSFTIFAIYRVILGLFLLK